MWRIWKLHVRSSLQSMPRGVDRYNCLARQRGYRGVQRACRAGSWRAKPECRGDSECGWLACKLVTRGSRREGVIWDTWVCEPSFKSDSSNPPQNALVERAKLWDAEVFNASLCHMRPGFLPRSTVNPWPGPLRSLPPTPMPYHPVTPLTRTSPRNATVYDWRRQNLEEIQPFVALHCRLGPPFSLVLPFYCLLVAFSLLQWTKRILLLFFLVFLSRFGLS